jgi:hypothetical protein
VEVILGAFLLTGGSVSLVMRFVAPNSPMFSKLGAMQRALGPRAGLAVHVGLYTIFPMVTGTLMLLRAFLDDGAAAH